ACVGDGAEELLELVDSAGGGGEGVVPGEGVALGAWDALDAWVRRGVQVEGGADHGDAGGALGGRGHSSLLSTCYVGVCGLSVYALTAGASFWGTWWCPWAARQALGPGARGGLGCGRGVSRRGC